MTTKDILQQLPYTAPFLFVDELLEVTEAGARGRYTYKPGEYFYQGHFTNNPVTPGVILTETMAQAGLVCLGMYLLRDEPRSAMPLIALTSVAIDFLLPVFPGETVTVISQKEYFRFNKLKCKVQMSNSEGKIVCSGTISGIIKHKH